MGPEGFAATPTALGGGALGTVTNRSAPSWEGIDVKPLPGFKRFSQVFATFHSRGCARNDEAPRLARLMSM
jgi:hypothetical protein